MRLEIAASGLGPIGADRIQPRRIGRKQLIGIRVDIAGQLEQRIRASGFGQLKVNPAAFLAPADRPESERIRT